MSRRLTYVALLVTSVVLAACSQPTAPNREDTIVCDGITVVVATGLTCDDM
jgi:hypothetical protein